MDGLKILVFPPQSLSSFPALESQVEATRSIFGFGFGFFPERGMGSFRQTCSPDVGHFGLERMKILPPLPENLDFSW